MFLKEKKLEIRIFSKVIYLNNTESIDFLVFYIEPLGFIGTLSAMVLGFVPYIIPRADAMFPEYEEFVKHTYVGFLNCELMIE